MNGSGPAGLPQVIASLQALVAAKEAEVNEVKGTYDGLMAELRQLNAMLRAAQPAERKGHGGARPGARRRYGQEELAIVVAQLREQGRAAVEDIPGSFTVGSVEALGMSKSRAERIVKYLRDTEQARLVGERQVTRGARPSKVYLLNDDV